MLIDFDNPTIASVDEVKDFTVEDLKAICSKSKGGKWVCTAYVETPKKIIVCAISHGKKPKQVMREALTNATNRIKEFAQC